MAPGTTAIGMSHKSSQPGPFAGEISISGKERGSQVQSLLVGHPFESLHRRPPAH